MSPNLKGEVHVYRQLHEIRNLLEARVISPEIALKVTENIEASDAPLAAHKRACFVDYLKGLSDVWIQPKNRF